MAAAFDRSKISNPKASLLIASIGMALGHDLNDLTFSERAIRKARLDARKTINETII